MTQRVLPDFYLTLPEKVMHDNPTKILNTNKKQLKAVTFLHDPVGKKRVEVDLEELICLHIKFFLLEAEMQ
jgi:hypothetical protein